MNPSYDTTNVRLLINYIILIIIKCHRFKKLYICDGKTAEERLLKEILNVSLPSPVVQDVGAFGSEASQNFARSNHSIWDGHDLSVCEANAAKKGEATKKTKGLVSTNNYLTQDIMPRETDPLLWWKEKAACNPLLLPLIPVVKKFSSIPATSCPSEQAFSIVGQIDAPRRNRLSPDNMDMLLFLHKNT